MAAATWTSALVFALASAGAAMAATAADAMFLAELGPAHLGVAVAVSSALLALVLAVVGGLGDRLERRRVLVFLAALSALVLAVLAAVSFFARGAAAVAALIGGKQLAAATDLAFWIAAAERLDARRSRRAVPVLAAMGGAGAAIGGVLVVPIAGALGARGVLAGAAAVLAGAAVLAMRLPATRRLTGAPRLAGLVVRAWRDGAHAVRRHPLARHLAIVVGLAGVFASLAYFALAVSVAAEGGSAGALAAVLGGVRGSGQLVTLLVQLTIAPRLLARTGTGYALLLAPLVALAASLGLVVAPVLAMAIATQISARVLDAGVETPAEKLAQTLLPGAVRGRVAGFLDGTAKRTGAMIGGLIAAALADAPAAFYAACAVAAALWLVFAGRIARELPALAVNHAGRDADPEVDEDRATALLLRELAGPSPERAAELLARVHGRGRAGGVDLVGALVAAAITRGGLWRAVISVLDVPAPAHAAAIAAALATASPQDRVLVIRALGLAGGAQAGAALERAAAGGDRAVALTAAIAGLRASGASTEIGARIDDAVRDAEAVDRSVVVSIAIDELGVEIACALAASDLSRAMAAARRLARVLRRGGDRDVATRAAGFAALARVVTGVRSAELALLRADLLELARDRVDQAASPPAPAHMLASLIRQPGGRGDPAPEIAAALALYGALLDGEDRVDADDLRRLARALGEPDDAVRAAAEVAIAGLGDAATGELIATVAWGRRRARDRAAALLADLPVTEVMLDRLVDGELEALDRTHAAIAALGAPGDALLARRLDERLGEVAYTVLLLVAARQRSRAITRAAAAWRHARGGHERARTLAVIDAALPRAQHRRLVDAVDALSPAERAMALTRAGVAVPSRDAVIRQEIAGRDRLARALALHALGAAERSAHRDAIAGAARAEVLATSPHALAHKLSHALSSRRPPDASSAAEGEPEMPSRIETLIALSRVPLLASLTTRQLADLAERARWSALRDGAIVVTAGDLIDALIVVDDGELVHGEHRIGKGEVVDELACVAPVEAVADVRVVRAARLIRLERIDFEELVDDVPGLAAAVCRALGERARRAAHASYRSPLTSRGP